MAFLNPHGAVWARCEDGLRQQSHLPTKPLHLGAKAVPLTEQAAFFPGRVVETRARAIGGSGTLYILAAAASRLFIRVQHRSRATNQVDIRFTTGDGLAGAKRFAEQRHIAIVPWSQNVEPRPIFVISDGTGETAKAYVMAAFAQFGCSEKANLIVAPKVTSEEAVRKAVARAAKIIEGGALAVHTFASKDLTAFLHEECVRQEVQCFGPMDPLLAAMERRFGLERSVVFHLEKESDSLADVTATSPTVFVASDSKGSTAASLARVALRQFQDCEVETITICSEVRTLEEINHIAQAAFESDSLVVFTFASPGMSRFMRQQCERLKVIYADVYQPALIAFEKFLNYPPVGVPGGLDLKDLHSATLKWEEQPV